MTEILYFPVIDCELTGIEKIAMIPTRNINTVKAQSSMWLEEMPSHYFRLYSTHSCHNTDAFRIRCPRCGKVLYRIGQDINDTKHGLYECRSCNKIKEKTL